MSFVEKLWYGRNPVSWILWPLSLVFRCVSFLRRMCYRRGIFRVCSSRVPVVVVGNISVGGNGKTPTVIYLVESLKKRGFNPAVVSRGYGGHASEYPHVISDNSSPLECGDEPYLIYRRLGCLVAVDPVRERAVRKLEELGADVIISDDGLQHYSMGRAVELVVVDGSRRFGNGAVLPMGPLREGLWRLGEVDAVICNGDNPSDGEFKMSVIPMTPVKVRDYVTPLAEKGKVLAVAGIGNPEKFFNLLRKEGYDLVRTVSLADHAAYTQEMFAGIIGDWDGIVLMTEKDAAKCRDFASDKCYFLPIDAVISPDIVELIISKIGSRQQ